jgi:hypothetical protein
MRPRKFKTTAVLAGIVSALVLAGLAAAWLLPARYPVEVTLVSVRDDHDSNLARSEMRNNNWPDGVRMVTVSLHNRKNAGLRFESADACEIRRRGNWIPLPQDSQLLSHFTAMFRLAENLDQVTVFAPQDTDAVRIKIIYRPNPQGRPFGIGNDIARYNPPSRASRWLQGAVKPFSTPLYDWLWPDYFALRTAGWKTATVEIVLPTNSLASPPIYSGRISDALAIPEVRLGQRR